MSNVGIAVTDNDDGTATLTSTTLEAVPTSQPPADPAAVLALSPGYTDAAAAGAISWAQTQVEDYCERRFAERSSQCTVTAHYGQALLPDPPVTAVTEVLSLVRWPLSSQVLSWQPIDISTVQWSESGELYDARAYCTPGDVPWSMAPRGLKVTYTHGFTTWPQAVVDMVVALAAAYLVNPAGLSERRVLDTTYRWMAGVGHAGVADPFAGLARYVLRECG